MSAISHRLDKAKNMASLYLLNLTTLYNVTPKWTEIFVYLNDVIEKYSLLKGL